MASSINDHRTCVSIRQWYLCLKTLKFLSHCGTYIYICVKFTSSFFFSFTAMLIYRTQRNIRKRRLKLLHAGIMISVVVLTVIALIAVFDSHNLAPTPIPNMYSLHSWVGLTTVILFCCQVNSPRITRFGFGNVSANLALFLQWVAGCVSFLYPGLHPSLRASIMPIHVYFGVAGFIGAIASCLIGLNEKAIFTLKLVAR